VVLTQHGTLVTIVSAVNHLFPSLQLCTIILTIPMCGCVTESVMPVAIGLDRLACVVFPVWWVYIIPIDHPLGHKRTAIKKLLYHKNDNIYVNEMIFCCVFGKILFFRAKRE
jgi:hypothetical protein